VIKITGNLGCFQIVGIRRAKGRHILICYVLVSFDVVNEFIRNLLIWRFCLKDEELMCGFAGQNYDSFKYCFRSLKIKVNLFFFKSCYV
jgi:hypothetical protein